MITKTIKNTLLKHILKREDFIATDFMCYGKDADEDDFYLTYHAMPWFNGIVIQEEFMSHIENNTQYLFYDLHTKEFRECTEEEDSYMHEGDGNADAFRELDCEYICSKTIGNKINTFKGD